MKAWPRLWLAAALYGGAGLAVAEAPPPFAGPSRYVAGSFEELLDGLVRRGADTPQASLAAVQRLREQVDAGASPAARRWLLYAEAAIVAGDGDPAPGGANALRAHAQRERDPLAEAAADTVEAISAEVQGQVDAAAQRAQSALAVLGSACEIDALAIAAPAGGNGGPAARPLPANCDYRLAWRALRIVERRALGQGALTSAAGLASSGQQLAWRAGDAARQALSTAALGYLRAREGDLDSATRLLHQAQRLAQPLPDADAQASVLVVEASIAESRGDRGAARQALERALPLARRAGAERLEAQLLSNLTDVLVKSGQPGPALRAAEAALPIVRRHHDLRAERVLTHNAALAKVGLHRFAEARQDLNQVLALWQHIGATGDQAQALREFGEALGRAGDTQGALALYHRERELTAATMAENRRSALQTLQARNEMQRKQRDIELLGRDNALKAQALGNRSLTQRVWLLVALVMALSAALVALLYRRVRETNRRLVASHAQLRVQSERDPLTNLANRRHFQSVMQQRDALRGFNGALLLVDIDHFKHVNDGHGHAVGDVVLCEVARRLNQAVRTDDLVVRWGGEEFLILAPGVQGEALDALAVRVLQAVADTPLHVTLRAEAGRPVAATASLRVTVSIGYGRFPLPPHRAPVSWEQALNLADMALYIAKSQGRNRAVGLVAIAASGADELRSVEADFERAWSEGRITLAVTPGPSPEAPPARALVA
jgi:diguanylate cyclase (GGDEF)-like protein